MQPDPSAIPRRHAAAPLCSHSLLHASHLCPAVPAEAYLHDGYAHQELLHLAQQALDVFPGPHAQLRRSAPVQLSDGAQRRQTRHPARRHPQRLSARLEQEIGRLQASLCQPWHHVTCQISICSAQ